MQKGALPPTNQRVSLHTKEEINKKIQETTQRNIEYYKSKSNEEIIARIESLDKEWDIERVLETNAASMILLSSFLSLATRKKHWAIFTGIISGFLLQHALQGWCPPLPLFRRMGVRTSLEINEEKTNLKALNNYSI